LPAASIAKGTHRMVAGQRQARNDGLRRSGQRDPVRRQRITHDAIIALGIEVTLVDRDAGPALVAVGRSGANAYDLVGPSIARGVLQSPQKPAGWGRAL
jgi:hypothetical protein